MAADETCVPYASESRCLTPRSGDREPPYTGVAHRVYIPRFTPSLKISTTFPVRICNVNSASGANGRREGRVGVKLSVNLFKLVLLYGCEMWKVDELDNRRLDTFRIEVSRKGPER